MSKDIAIIQGYHARQNSPYMGYVIVNPKGDESDVVGETETKAWFYAIKDGFVPKWMSDTDLALSLMIDGCSLSRCNPDEWPGSWECSSQHPGDDPEMCVTEYAMNTRQAVCKWYTAYHKVLK